MKEDSEDKWNKKREREIKTYVQDKITIFVSWLIVVDNTK